MWPTWLCTPIQLHTHLHRPCTHTHQWGFLIVQLFRVEAPPMLRQGSILLFSRDPNDNQCGIKTPVARLFRFQICTLKPDLSIILPSPRSFLPCFKSPPTYIQELQEHVGINVTGDSSNPNGHCRGGTRQGCSGAVSTLISGKFVCRTGASRSQPAVPCLSLP